MKRYLSIAILLLLFSVLAACGTTDVEEEPAESDETEEVEEVEDETEEEVEDEEDDATSDEDETEAEEDETSSEEASDDADEDGDKIKEEGTFNGQADPHTVEIETEEGIFAFQLSMDARELVETIEAGSQVEFTYTEDGDQRTIEDISVIE